MRWSAGPLLFLVATSACTSPALRQARSSNWQELESTLSESSLGPREVRRIAAEVLRQEVTATKDLPDRGFITSLRSCSGPLESALRQRMKRHDGTGAEAAMLLLETGRLMGNPARHHDDEDGAWRALAARANLLDPVERQRDFEDPDERVRAAALRASTEARDPSDVEALLEVARLDPSPLLRSRAVSAVGRIGGPDILQPMKDRFDESEEALRLAFVDAFGSAKLYPGGGRKELQRIATTERGVVRIAAASRLAHDDEPEVRNSAHSILVRAVEAGSQDERRLALRVLPLNASGAPNALLSATGDADLQVALIAWARLLGHSETRSAAEQQLLTWSKREDELAHQALAALASAGVDSARPQLVALRTHPDAATRVVVGRGLIRLGALDQAAPLLADADASVRRRVSCDVVGRPAIGLEP